MRQPTKPFRPHLPHLGVTHCIECEAEAPLDSDGRCDFCSIESSEAEHEWNNTALNITRAIRAEYEKCRQKGQTDAEAALETLERLFGGYIPDVKEPS